MKAIETRYAGCRFRSRLEARWAVFFDVLKVKWEYEPEGFALDKSGWYLPDFRLPELSRYVEIKGGKLTQKDARKCIEFGRNLAIGEGQWSLRVLIGDIPRACVHDEVTGDFVPAWSVVPGRTPPIDSETSVNTVDMDGGTFIGMFSTKWDTVQAEDWIINPSMWYPPAAAIAVNQALEAARSARFEHGESGLRSS